MKKLLLTLSVAMLLFGGSMTVQAYNEVVNGVQCACTITGTTSVNAYTAATDTTVTVTSTAYDKADSSIGGSGNAGNGYAGVTYTTTSQIDHATQVHTAPNLGVKVELVQYAY